MEYIMSETKAPMKSTSLTDLPLSVLRHIGSFVPPVRDIVIKFILLYQLNVF